MIKKKSDNIYIIEKDSGMNVPGIVFASDSLFSKIREDKTIEQIKNVAKLPGIVKSSMAMADAHLGYGFCVGGVAAFDLNKGIISPGGIGFDINCGIRLLSTNLNKKNLNNIKPKILDELYKNIPSGVGHGTKHKYSENEINEILKNGSKWALENDFATKEDIIFTEDQGCIPNADPNKVSPRAKARGKNQIGTIGAGNHFIEIQFVDKIFNNSVASTFNLKKDQVVILIHTGSRGLGHQVASDYIQKMEKQFGIDNLPDRQLINAPIKSELGKSYLSAMAAAANFAFVNRQLITFNIRESFSKFFPNIKINVVYYIAHNIAKFEKFIINGKETTLCVHRKGATRSFGPGRKEIPLKYQKTGCPIFIPGSMGTSSYVLVGTNKARDLSFASTAHGAGRVLSRTFAKNNLSLSKVKQDLKDKDIIIKAGSEKGILEEAPEAYKDVDEVVKVSDDLSLGKIVAKLKPLAVMKG